VLARKIELEDALSDLGPHDEQQRTAIVTALSEVYALMTGDLARRRVCTEHLARTQQARRLIAAHLFAHA